MFTHCYYLTELDLGSFDTSSVTRMEEMFAYCRSLKSLNVSSFDTSNVGSFQQMFSACIALTELDLRNFEFKSNSSLTYIFGSVGNDNSSPTTITITNNRGFVDRGDLGSGNYQIVYVD